MARKKEDIRMWFFSQEEKELRELARQVALKELAPVAEELDEKEEFNLKAFKKMGELGFLGITASPDYGGLGLGAVAATVAMEEFGRSCASSALSYLAHSILCVNNLEQNANSLQKKHYLPKLISGEWIGCMGMSEPDYGSDALGMQTSAKKDATKGHYLLNGTKMWITNAQYADVAYVYTRTGKEKKNLSTFIVTKGTPGFRAGKPIHKMGMRASPTGELIFENAQVPFENLVGQEGDSTLHMLKNLEMERITISGISLGLAQACLDVCLPYVKNRKQFGLTLSNFQLIQKMIAEMSAEVEMMRHFIYSVARDYDQGNKGPGVAAKVKLCLPKMATKIAMDAIQILGGYGYSREFPVERFARDSKLIEIGAGTNEVMILIIAKELLRDSLCQKNF